MAQVKDIIVRKPTPDEVDTCSKWPIWTCQPKTFDYEYSETETCLILEGCGQDHLDRRQAKYYILRPATGHLSRRIKMRLARRKGRQKTLQLFLTICGIIYAARHPCWFS